MPFCVVAETAGHGAVAFCSFEERPCAVLAEWAREHGDSWMIRDEGLRLSRAGDCEYKGVQLDVAPTTVVDMKPVRLP